MERVAGLIFFILFIVAIGAGGYGYTQHEGYVAAQSQLATAEARAKTAEAASADVTKRLTASGGTLTSCQNDLLAANKRADDAEQKAAPKSGGARHR